MHTSLQANASLPTLPYRKLNPGEYPKDSEKNSLLEIDSRNFRILPRSWNELEPRIIGVKRRFDSHRYYPEQRSRNEPRKEKLVTLARTRIKYRVERFVPWSVWISRRKKDATIIQRKWGWPRSEKQMNPAVERRPATWKTGACQRFSISLPRLGFSARGKASSIKLRLDEE